MYKIYYAPAIVEELYSMESKRDTNYFYTLNSRQFITGGHIVHILYVE